MPANTTELEKRLWGAADELRANSKLKSSEYSVPVLGLIFLRYADHKFAKAKAKLTSQGSGRRTIGRADYQAQGVLDRQDLFQDNPVLPVISKIVLVGHRVAFGLQQFGKRHAAVVKYVELFVVVELNDSIADCIQPTTLCPSQVATQPNMPPCPAVARMRAAHKWLPRRRGSEDATAWMRT
jgi:HsdM-like protein